MFFFYLGKWVAIPEDLKLFLDSGRLSFDDLETLLRKCRADRPDMTVGTLSTFIHIARRATPGAESALTIARVASDLELTYPTAARHCDILSTGVRGQPGLRWIHKEPVTGTRKKMLFMTELGVGVLEEMAAIQSQGLAQLHR